MNTGRFISLHRLACFVILVLHLKFAYSSSSSIYTNLSSSSARRFCSDEESYALLQFKRTFIINSDASSDCDHDDDFPSFIFTLYDPTTGRSFPKTKYWNAGSDCCSWVGVTCDEVSGHVIKLDLSCSQLQGSIHSNSSLFKLSHLRNLNLAFNNFAGSQISSEFGQFSALTHLNLSNSQFSGAIPSEISNLSRLVSLDLSIGHPMPSGFSFQGQKVHLKSLDILLQHLTQLRKLVLDAVDVSFSVASKSYMGGNLSSSPNSYSLTYLSLRGCQLQKFPEDIFHWPYFRRLQILDLCYATLAGEIPDSISSLKSLKYLDISFSNLQGRVPKWIGNLTKLTHLDLSFSRLSGQVSSTSFSNLEQLEFLDLSFNGFEGQIPNSFANLKKLKFLRLDLNGFIGGFPSSFANLSQLNHLSISHNYLTHIPADTRGFQLISVMDLSSNALSGTIPSWLYSRPSLVTLNLQDNRLTGEISPHIGNLLNLSELILSSNLIGGMIPPSLFSLPSLETLQLDNNLLFGPLPSNITGLQKLNHLNLSNNTLNYTIPSALLVLPSLKYLGLSVNNLTGYVGEFQTNLPQAIDLSNNNLQGVCFSSISNLVNLTSLNLASNNLTGSLEMDVFVGLQNLRIVNLSYNSHLSLNSSAKINSPLTELTELQMSNCNVSAFPLFLRNLVGLRELDLSNNKIHGSLPEWLGSMGKSSLTFLNLSHNFLTSSVDILPWGNLTHVDLSSNLLQGALPVPPATTMLYFISNNQLSGKIHPRICDLSELWLVNFSNNSLSGNIPDCLFKTEYISLLNLRRNNFSGTIPETVGGTLTTLDLSHNQLDGHIPRSLANCTSLEILDLGYNFFSDTFPSWLETLPELKILVLSSNRFYGRVAKPRNASAFTKLNVIDLSYNKFSGNLPSHYFHRWKSMMMKGDNSSSPDSMKGAYYSDSVTLVNKGREMELVRTLTIFKAVDFSNNNFEGKIPESIGNLKSLVVLNLSSNGLIGDIPSSLGNLVQLESLDFSNNKLSGRIPQQFKSLTFLAAFNVSQNNLEGPIPQAGQLSTFSYDSYKDNPGLCGIPLPKKCEELPVPRSPILPFEEDRGHDTILDGFNWKSVATGYGCGAIVGILVGNVIIRRNEEWVLSIFNIRLLWQMKKPNKARK